MKLTETQMKEIDELFLQYQKDKDKEKLMKELEKFAAPDGSWSLYVRWALDSL